MNFVSNQQGHKLFTRPGASLGSLFEIGLLVTISILLYMYLLGPKLDEYHGRQDTFRDLEKQYSDLQRQEQVFQNLQTQMRDKVESVNLLDNTLPLNDKLTRMYILVNDLAGRAGINAASIGVQPDSSLPAAGDKVTLTAPFTAARRLATVPVVVSGTGTIDQLSGFLRLVETSTRLLDVTSMDISQGQDDQLIFKVALQGYTYIPTAPTAAGSANIGQQPAQKP